jgi:hypothetical protein
LFSRSKKNKKGGKMRKTIIALMLLVSMSAVWAVYNVGDTVDPADNISWTIDGPPGHPEVGKSDNMFNMVGSKLKPVVIFFGQEW